MNGYNVPALCVELGVRDADGVPLVNSRHLSQTFDKRHDNVLADIDRLRGSPEISGYPSRASWFREIRSINEQNGQFYRAFDVTQDGFTLLVMGWTGDKAIQFKIRYIEAFNLLRQAMEERLLPSTENDDQLIQRALLLVHDRLAAANKKIEEIEPDANAFQRIKQSEGSLCITTAAKMLKIKPKKLFSYLQIKRWIYRRQGNKEFIAYQSHIDNGDLEQVPHEIRTRYGETKIAEQARITASGYAKLAKRFANPELPA